MDKASLIGDIYGYALFFTFSVGFLVGGIFGAIFGKKGDDEE